MLDPVQSTSTAYDLSCDGTTILIDAICGWGFFPFMNIFLWHAMDVVIPVSNCRHGGLVTRHHNEVWDVLGDLASPAYKDAVKEPIVCECEGDGMALIADFGVKGMWQPQGLFLISGLLILMLLLMLPNLFLPYWQLQRKRRNGSMELVWRLAMHPSYHLWCQWMVPLVVRLHFYFVILLTDYL